MGFTRSSIARWYNNFYTASSNRKSFAKNIVCDSPSLKEIKALNKKYKHSLILLSNIDLSCQHLGTSFKVFIHSFCLWAPAFLRLHLYQFAMHRYSTLRVFFPVQANTGMSVSSKSKGFFTFCLTLWLRSQNMN